MLNSTDQIANGKTYVFHFTSDGFGKLAIEDVKSRLRAVAGLNVADAYFGGALPLGLFSGDLTVVCSFTRDGWTVQQLAENMEGALDSGLGNFTFTSVSGQGVIPEIKPEYKFAAIVIVIFFLGLILSSFAKGAGEGVGASV